MLVRSNRFTDGLHVPVARATINLTLCKEKPAPQGSYCTGREGPLLKNGGDVFAKLLLSFRSVLKLNYPLRSQVNYNTKDPGTSHEHRIPRHCEIPHRPWCKRRSNGLGSHSIQCCSRAVVHGGGKLFARALRHARVVHDTMLRVPTGNKLQRQMQASGTCEGLCK